MVQTISCLISFDLMRFCRTELGTQVSQLAQDLSTLRASFQSMQDFAQLPLVFIWQQQLKSVMQQALTHELSSLPQSLRAESAQRVLSGQESTSSRPHQQLNAGCSWHNLASEQAPVSEPDVSSLMAASQAASAAEPAVTSVTAASTAASEACPTPQAGSAELTDMLIQDPGSDPSNQPLTHGPHEALPQQASSAPPRRQTAPETIPQQVASHRLPQQARPAESSGQTPHARMPHKAMPGSLPKQALPAQATFLRVCMAELLRLTNPTQSQFQPLLCGWYTQGTDSHPLSHLLSVSGEGLSEIHATNFYLLATDLSLVSACHKFILQICTFWLQLFTFWLLICL